MEGALATEHDETALRCMRNYYVYQQSGSYGGGEDEMNETVNMTHFLHVSKSQTTGKSTSHRLFGH